MAVIAEVNPTPGHRLSEPAPPAITRWRRRLISTTTHGLVQPFRRPHPPSKQVAVLVPWPGRSELTDDERISLRHLRHHLPRHDKFLIVPHGSDFSIDGFHRMHFPARFFGSAAKHGMLLATRGFYRAFLDYEFVFFHHLDSLILAANLGDWCRPDIDYIGPPWIRCPDSPWVTRPRVGNGGCTLLRVDAALRALTCHLLDRPSALWFGLFTTHAPDPVVGTLAHIERILPGCWPAARLMREWREVHDPSRHNRNNDLFWSDRAAIHDPTFKVASLDDGLRFAFEVAPRECFEMNGRQLPLGAHAWTRYDRSFWEPHLLPEPTSRS